MSAIDNRETILMRKLVQSHTELARLREVIARQAEGSVADGSWVRQSAAGGATSSLVWIKVSFPLQR